MRSGIYWNFDQSSHIFKDLFSIINQTLAENKLPACNEINLGFYNLYPLNVVSNENETNIYLPIPYALFANTEDVGRIISWQYKVEENQKKVNEANYSSLDPFLSITSIERLELIWATVPYETLSLLWDIFSKSKFFIDKVITNPRIAIHAFQMFSTEYLKKNSSESILLTGDCYLTSSLLIEDWQYESFIDQHRNEKWNLEFGDILKGYLENTSFQDMFNEVFIKTYIYQKKD